MEHIGRKEVFFVVLFLFLLGVPASAENGSYQEAENEIAYQLQMMKSLMKCLKLHDELMAKQKTVEFNTNEALKVFKSNLKSDVFYKVRDRSEAYLGQSEELLKINREIINHISNCKKPDELSDAIRVIAYNQTIILFVFNELCVLTDVAAGHMADEIKVSRKAGSRKSYFDFL